MLDVGVFADQQGMPACNPDTTFRVDPITNVPFLHDDPQVGKPLSTVKSSPQFCTVPHPMTADSRSMVRQRKLFAMIVQVRNAYLPQYLGQYSGPWHLAQAIRGSPYVTTDLDAADIVYVYDYCYYTWWLSFVHSNGRVQRDDPSPGDHLLKSYQVCALHSKSYTPFLCHITVCV